MKVCYIVGAGDFKSPFTPNEEDLVIAADGGYDTLKKYGIRCDLLIGDLDSIDGLPSGVELQRHPIKKDSTDMHLCYLEGKRRGYTEFRIMGGTGGREDHTFANFSLLLCIRESGDNAILYGQKNLTRVIKNERITVYGEPGMHFSAFAFGGDAAGVTIEGFEYEARDITLTPSFPLAVSNIFTRDRGTVEVKDGSLLIMVEIA